MGESRTEDATFTLTPAHLIILKIMILFNTKVFIKHLKNFTL